MVDEKQEEYALSVSDREQVWAPTAEKQNIYFAPSYTITMGNYQPITPSATFPWMTLLDSSAVKSQTCNQSKLTMYPQTIPGL